MAQKIDLLAEEIALLRKDLHRYMETSRNADLSESFEKIRNDYLEPIKEFEMTRAEDCLSDRMVRDCSVRDTCYEFFTRFLRQVNTLVGQEDVSDEMIDAYRQKIAAIQKTPRYTTCPTCFGEINRLFDQHVSLLKALRVNQKKTVTLHGDGELCVPDFVNAVLEPLSNIVRFQILQSIAAGPKSYTELSKITGLRGGNLLFHINRLTEANFLVQRRDRGDYLISMKGELALQKMQELSAQMVEEN